VSAPMVCMNRNASVREVTILEYLLFKSGSLTCPSSQSRGPWRSASPELMAPRMKLSVLAEWKYALDRSEVSRDHMVG
jgi:hypothetical protein